MSDKMEDSDVFEIVDFTTASDWERFTSRLEEIIHEWKLTGLCSYEPPVKVEHSAGSWSEVSEEVDFADFPFVATYFSLNRGKGNSLQQQDEVKADSLPGVLLDMMNPGNDFPAKAHCLTRWYGLRGFVVLSPKAYAVTNVSRVNMLLSSVAMAINNSGCQVPIFVQVHEKWRRLYLGHFESGGLRTMFEMVHLKQIPPRYCHLSGLVELFRAKMNTPAYPLPRVSVVIRLTYVLTEWPEPINAAHELHTGKVERDHIQGEASASSGTELSDLLELPLGMCDDPVSELHLAATWPDVDDDVLTESEVYSDLDPLEAPLWSIRIKMADDPQGLLSLHLAELTQLCSSDESVEQALGRPASSDIDETGASISTALERLTEPHVPINIDVSSALHKVVSNTTSRLQKRGENIPIPECDLNQILEYLFPDSKESGKAAKPEKQAKTTDSLDPKDVFSQFKTAPVDSLLFKLSTCYCVANYKFGGIKAVAHLWHEFVLEMRYRWDNRHGLPGLEQGSPNLRYSILYQKLQMLNCCIERKTAREQASQNLQHVFLLDRAPAAGTGGASGRSQSISGSSDTFESTAKSEDPEGGSVGGVARAAASASSSSKCSADEAEKECRPKGHHVGSRSPSSSRADENDGNESDEFFECDEGSSLPPDLPSESDAEAVSTQVDCPAERATVSDATAAAGPSATAELPYADSSGSCETNLAASRTPPEGRLRQCGELTLLSAPDVPLYIPVTQEPAPMTEDMLAEHADVLTKLGTSAEGASLRARMQSASLLSDMESFKAANPGCLLEDFVRWYSPRDFIADSDAKRGGGTLSERMLVPGNMWVEVWNNAKPVPARRQRRLFDDTKEAEKVLHYLASLKPGQVAIHLLPIVVQAAIMRLKKDANVTESVGALMDSMAARAASLSRHTEQTAALYSDLLRQVRLVETAIGRARSLCAKFPVNSIPAEGASEVKDKTLASFVRSLLEQPEVAIAGGAKTPAGAAVVSLFSAAAQQQQHVEAVRQGAGSRRQGEGHGAPGGQLQEQEHAFGAPVAKEYILRAVAACPAPHSRASPQRLYCTLLPNEARMAGAFTHDTTFQ